MLREYWPLVDVRIQTGDLTLRPMTEQDAVVVADTLPSDVELDPAATMYDIGDNSKQRGTVTLQHYWKCYGNWTSNTWRLNFVVEAQDQFVGVQEIEGNDFPKFRTVDSSSHLLTKYRGRGWGKQMRVAALVFAFDHLGAEAAITSAYHDNHASLAVSRSLGYEPNGLSFESRGKGVDVLQHMRMTKKQWELAGHSSKATVDGFEPCRALFGLTSGEVAGD